MFRILKSALATSCLFAFSASASLSAPVTVIGPIVAGPDEVREIAIPFDLIINATELAFGDSRFGYLVDQTVNGGSVEFAVESDKNNVVDLGEGFTLDSLTASTLTWTSQLPGGNNTGNLYNDLSGEVVLEVGDQAYVGARLTPAGDQPVGYAFFDVTRGSVIVNSYTYNFGGGVTTPGGVPPIAPIPLPAGLPLLLAGLGGFAVLRRCNA